MARGRADPGTVRPATRDDADTIARLHVECWQEAYAGILPSSEINRYTVDERAALWRSALTKGQHIHVAPGIGFAQMGHQREGAFAARGYTAELWSLYVLKRAYGTGLGRALLCAAISDAPHPFTACVLSGNTRALAFYRKTGADILNTRADFVGETPITEHVLGWSRAAALAV